MFKSANIVLGFGPGCPDVEEPGANLSSREELAPARGRILRHMQLVVASTQDPSGSSEKAALSHKNSDFLATEHRPDQAQKFYQAVCGTLPPAPCDGAINEAPAKL